MRAITQVGIEMESSRISRKNISLITPSLAEYC
jgi:hypothetical protein